VEEQFYLLWPQVVRRASPRDLAAIAAGLLVLASAVRFLILMRHSNAHNMLAYSTFTRIDGIAIGILISVALGGKAPSLSMGKRLALVLLGVAGLMGASEFIMDCAPDAVPTLLGGMLGFPLAGVSCAFLFLAVLGLSVERLPWVRWFRLVYLGKISYGLYVYHLLALLVVRNALGPLRMVLYPAYVLLGFALTLVFSVASYQFLELPFLKLKERFTYVLSRPE
jgi:peptidoglycan/LPS O-acetylase OafA/YrhL